MSNAENTEPGDAKLDVSSSHSADKQEEASGSNNDVSIRGNSENEGKKKLKKEDKPPTKVVIRRLPPTMEEEAFLQAVSPLPEHDHFEYIKGDFSLGPHSFSRCYINFNNQEDIFSFTETFDQYVFLGAKGQEYPALVEYAPFQRIPRAKPKKKDPLAGTIETDPFFIAFKKLLEEEAERNAKAPSGGVGIQSYVEAEAAPNEAAESTPLLDFLKHKKMEKARIREEKREERKKKELDRKMRQLALREKKSEAQKENFEEVENISQVHVLQSKDKKKELEKSDFDRKADDKERNPKFKKEERDKGFKEKLSPRSKETKFKSSNKNYSEDKGRKKEDKKKEGRQDAGEVPEDINRVSESSATKDGISDTGPATRRRSRGEKNKSNTVKERERKRLCEFMAKKQAKKKNCSGEENADGMTDAERANSGLTNERLVNHEDQAMGPSNASPKRRSSLESGEAKKAEEHFNEKRRNSADSGSSKSASKEIPGGECVSGKDSDRLCKSSRENNPEKQGSRGEKTKDPRTDRRIRNKDRPSIQIYRPGMGKFSKQRLEKEKVLGSSTEIDSPSHSPSPTPKPNSKQSSERHDLPNH